MSQSKYHLLKKAPLEKRKKFLNSLSEKEAEYLLYSPDFLLRPEQKMPKDLLDGSKRNWLIASGRGWGKNFAATYNLIDLIKNYGYKNIIYVGRTKEDVRDIIIDGPSGILKNTIEDVTYEGHKSRILFNKYGATVRLRSGESPDSLRGPNTDLIIFDELAAYQYPQETWDNGQFGLRMNSSKGFPPICIITTTPRPIDLIKELVKDSDTITTVGSTYENPDLSDDFIRYLRNKYENTTIGKQELYGQILENIEGALWKPSMISYKEMEEEFERVVIAIDPAVTSHKDSDSTGIVVVGLKNKEYYVIDDKSGKYSALEWANMVEYLYNYYSADRVIAEVNQGGDLVESNLRNINKNISYKSVRAFKGKYLRAEPISSLYEQGKVYHTKVFTELEDEMTTYVPGVNKSPDRLDALVYGLIELSSKREVAPPKGFAIPKKIF